MAYPKKSKRGQSVPDQKNQELPEIVVSFGPPSDDSAPVPSANPPGDPAKKAASTDPRQLIFRFGQRS